MARHILPKRAEPRSGDRHDQSCAGHHRGGDAVLPSAWARPPTEPSLGTLIPEIGQRFLFSGEWWILFFPALTLLVLALAVNLLGDWLRDALNPRLR